MKVLLHCATNDQGRQLLKIATSDRLLFGSLPSLHSEVGEVIGYQDFSYSA